MVEHAQSVQVSSRPRSSRRFVVRDPAAKFGLLVVVAGAVGLVFLAESTWLSSSASVLTSLILLASVYVLTRLFRAAGESHERPWWKLTATPVSSVLVSGYFLLVGLWPLLSGSGMSLWLLAAALVCCVAFAASAVLMRRRGSGG
ncbi:MAG: hypothetical protein Q4G21_11480 [Dermabacter sp.]|nr:hypothetical protein [Dermabacter sp.]